MTSIVDKIRINNPLLDRRVKLTPEQKNDIQNEWNYHIYCSRNGLIHEAISQRKLAKKYGVSRRLIQFIIDPQKRLDNVERRRERGGSMIYYKKEEWKFIIRDHRAYKKELLKKNLI